MRRHYSEGRFFSYLRKRFGIEKPVALPWGEWDLWHERTKADHPVGYFLTETLPDQLEWIPKVLVDPFHDMAYYCRNRFVRKTHILRTTLKPSRYHDLSERILDGLMCGLVDFVEIEKARAMIRWQDEGRSYRLVRGRSREAGLAYLSWEAGLDDPGLKPEERSDGQAQTAREIRAIYTWWTEVRPKRPDPYETSDWNEVSGYVFDRANEKKEEIERSLATIRATEEAYLSEDDQMLMRLLAIRPHLWQ